MQGERPQRKCGGGGRKREKGGGAGLGVEVREGGRARCLRGHGTSAATPVPLAREPASLPPSPSAPATVPPLACWPGHYHRRARAQGPRGSGVAGVRCCRGEHKTSSSECGVTRCHRGLAPIPPIMSQHLSLLYCVRGVWEARAAHPDLPSASHKACRPDAGAQRRRRRRTPCSPLCSEGGRGAQS